MAFSPLQSRCWPCGGRVVKPATACLLGTGCGGPHPERAPSHACPEWPAGEIVGPPGDAFKPCQVCERNAAKNKPALRLVTLTGF